jgi:hypothetical protein
MALGFTTWFAAVVIVRMKAELADRRIRALRIAQIARD